jgi:hypothetical protein
MEVADMTASTRRSTNVFAAFCCAALVAGSVTAERADSKRFPKKVIKKVSAKRLGGAYKGVTEQGTAVSFRLTKQGKIVDFVVPVTLSCETDVGDLDGDGTYTYYGGEIVQSIKQTTLKSAPIPGKKKEARYPLGTKFEYSTPFVPDSQPPPGTELVEYTVRAEWKSGLDSGRGSNIYWPVPKRVAVMTGEVYMGRRNGPFTSHAPGRERCVLSDDGEIVTHVNALDWEAKKRRK